MDLAPVHPIFFPQIFFTLKLSPNPDTFYPEDDNKSIPCKLIKEILDKSLDVLGQSIKQWIFEDITCAGIVFDSDKPYSIHMISVYFEQTCGQRCSRFDERLYKELRSL